MRWLLFAAVLFASTGTGSPALADTFECTEAGVLAAVAQGGGPHRFDCEGPTTIMTSARISIPGDLILDGEGLLTLSGGDLHPVLFIDVGATVELRRLAVIDGRATLAFPCCDGAGIRNHGYLTLVECLVSGNSAPYGGGAGIFSSGFPSSGQTSLTLIDTTVSNNSARATGGISSTAGSSLFITGSTISGNVTTELLGGGIFSNSFVEIANSTISSNRALQLGGGGISMGQQTSELILRNVTFSGNQPDALRGGYAAEATNTIFDGGCSGSGSVASFGGNLESPGDTCGLVDPSDQVAVPDPMLAALGDYDGPSDTHALLPGSPAIDAGVDCPPPAVDQRGVSRPPGACDAGAYEFEVSEIPVDVDVEPGSDPNLINPFSGGVIPVAILGSDTFDVADVDLATLAFGPEGAAPTHAPGAHVEDVNDDGLDDLVSHYRTDETGIAMGDEDACVRGETLGDVPFGGCDEILTVHACGVGFELALLLPALMALRRRLGPPAP